MSPEWIPTITNSPNAHEGNDAPEQYPLNIEELSFPEIERRISKVRSDKHVNVAPLQDIADVLPPVDKLDILENLDRSGVTEDAVVLSDIYRGKSAYGTYRARKALIAGIRKERGEVRVRHIVEKTGKSKTVITAWFSWLRHPRGMSDFGVKP